MIYLYTLYIFSNLGALTLRCCCSPCLSLDFVAVAVAAIVPAFGGSVGCLLGREAAWRWNEGAPRCFRFTDIHSWKPCTRRAQRRVAPTRLRWGSAMCMSVLSCVPDRVLPKAPYSGFGNSIQLCQAFVFPSRAHGSRAASLQRQCCMERNTAVPWGWQNPRGWRPKIWTIHRRRVVSA